VDIPAEPRLICSMRLPASCPLPKSESPLPTKHLLPVFGLLFLLGGCATPWGGMRADHADAVASIKVYVPSPVETSAGNEIRCQIQSIDGVAAGSSDSLSPGKHRLIVALSSTEKEYVADADLIIPEAKNYRLKAEKKDDSFTLSLVEVDTAKTVATSTAPVNQNMKFLVFVLQK